MQADWTLDFGARLTPDGVQFRVWAPHAQSVAVQLGSEAQPLARHDEHIFEALVPEACAGTEYRYVIDGSRARPDPVSRYQAAGVHGPSRVIDPHSFVWSDADWRGLALEDYVLYELHIATFTRAGTFESAIARLRYLKQLGVNAIELMPVAEFPGTRNWGYDGVHLYAPQSSYGGPDGLKALVDACHREGLAVVLDVVYNHIGPEGNYLSEYAPFFTSRYRTPWGPAINFDGPESDGVRRFFIDNALYWIHEYHIDALRLDAIHGVVDSSARHILEELASTVQARAERLQRRVWLIAESDLNDVRVIKPAELGGYGIDAQWNDDFHHALHTVVTGQSRGYFADYGSMQDLAKSIAEGFVYDGRHSTYRKRRHGISSAARPGRQFVIFTQNHDQVANGSGGERISAFSSLAGQKLSAAVLLCAPNLPLLFMGQEYGETAPFGFFTSHGDADLVEAVRAGRREEFAAFEWNREFPDPQAESTFLASKLDWSLLEQPEHAALHRFYSELLTLRAASACLRNARKDLTQVSIDEQARWMVIERADPDGPPALCVFNFGAHLQTLSFAVRHVRWTCVMDSNEPRYGGSGEAGLAPKILESGVGSLRLAESSCAIYVSDRL
jgi:maltooligosyltrehalose trehalohydrolase